MGRRTFWTRRRFMRGPVAMTGAVAAGAVLDACATARAPAPARPTTAQPTTTLLVSIPFQGVGNYQGTMHSLTDAYIEKHWTSKHPGVAVKTVPGSGCNGSCTGAQSVTLNALSGQGPDTVCGCCNDLQTYLAANVLLPLDSLLKQNNVNTSDFSPGHLKGLQQDGKQMALPQYDGPMVLTYNQGMLDQYGLAYPAPDWDYNAADQLWRQVARTVKGKALYGAGLDTGDFNWQMEAFGGSEGSADGTRCLLDSSACANALTWMAGLLKDKVVSGSGPSTVRSGGVAFAMTGGWDIAYVAVNFQSLKWDFLPMPKFPSGHPSTFINNDFNAINAFSKNPQSLVWDIFQFITLDPGMQQFQYQTTLVTPNRLSLWPSWIELVRSVAPTLRNKHLEYYQQALEYGSANYFFRYDALQANTIKSGWFQKVLAGKVSPQVGLQQATTQINALETAGAARVPASVIRKEFPTQGPAIAGTPAGI